MLPGMLYRFGPFVLDLARFELRADGEPCRVEPQVFSLIALLVENRERLVSRDEIIEKIWDGRIVSDAAISSRIKSARQALGDDGKAQRYIRTIHNQGLRFVAPVQAARDDSAARIESIESAAVASARAHRPMPGPRALRSPCSRSAWSGMPGPMPPLRTPCPTN